MILSQSRGSMKKLLSIAISEGVRAARRCDTPSIEQRSTFPLIIQGGMGAAVSNWRLANAVARTGQLGVVSGTGIDTVFVRRLQDGDRGGQMRRGMEQFPIRRAADEAMRRYYRPEGRAPGEPYAMLPLYRQVVAPARQELTMLAAFVEVFLAKEGHDAPVGINLLTKIQLLTLPTLYGAMLAGVGYVLMGAGIPREIAGALDLLAGHHPARLRLDSVLAHAARGEVDVRTEPRASPTGFPIKVVEWAENPTGGATRERVCNLGYLRVAFMAADGKVDYRCPSEPEAAYVKKGGKMEDTIGRQCLCNALLSVIGHPQICANGAVEPPIVTSGNDLATIGDFLGSRTGYTAADVVAFLLSCRYEA